METKTVPNRPHLSLAEVRQMTAAALTRAQTANFLNVDPRSVDRGIADGTIPAVRVGRRILIPREPLLRLFECGSSLPPAA